MGMSDRCHGVVMLEAPNKNNRCEQVNKSTGITMILECYNDWRLGVKTGAKRECPDRESKPSAQHPHRTHRTHDTTTDQWRETILVARPKLGGLHSSPRVYRITRRESLASFWCLLVHFSKEI